MRIRLAVAFLLLTLAPIARSAHADEIADFYRGKTITLVIGAGDGGFYDRIGRLIAQKLRSYIPGEPLIVPQNMPGASQVTATEYSFNRAPRDGTSLLVVQPYVFLGKLLDPALRFDLQQLTWIGRVGPLQMIGGVVWHSAAVQSLDDARSKPAIFGGNSPTGPASMIPWALNQLAGTHFKVVRGYPSENAELVAMERGEIDGIGNANLRDLAKYPGQARVLYITGLDRVPDYPDAPTLVEAVPDAHDKPVIRLIAAITSVGITLVAPPGQPESRTAALRQAFDRMIADAQFRALLQKLDFEPDAMKGAALAQFMREQFSPAPDLISRLASAVRPQ